MENIKDSGDLHKAPSGKVHYTLVELEIWKNRKKNSYVHMFNSLK